MSFLVAWRLWCLLAVGGMAGAYVASIYRRRRDTVRFTNVALLDVVAPERPGGRRHLPAILWLTAAALVVVGFARPARDVRVPKDRATVVVALDVSLSMQATDVDPSRLEVARQAAVGFVDELPDNVNVGLAIFSGHVTSTAVSTDRAAAISAIESADLDEGTAIGEAIFAGLDLIEAAPPAEDGNPAPGRIVVLSDGETTVGRENTDAATAAADANVPVDTIAFGTPDGIIEVEGQREPVPVAPEPLQDIASTTDGAFYEADSLDALSSAYKDVTTVAGSDVEKRDISSWFIGAGLLSLCAAGLLSLLWSQRLP